MAQVPEMGEPGVFWRGADGQVWVKGDRGTNAAGNWDGANTIRYWSDRMYRQIADPMNNQPKVTIKQSTPTDYSNNDDSEFRPFNQALADATQRQLDQLPGLLQDALAAERRRYGNTTKSFDTQEQGQRKNWDESTTTNQQNYDSNLMAALRAGSRGVKNLMAILRGTGAAGGTAQDWVQDTVGDVTSGDIMTGANTQKENQTELDSSLNTFLTALKGKRQEAEDTFVNNERAVRAANSTRMQDLLQKMAGYYSEAGRTGEADSFVRRASDLTPDIARNSRAQVSNYDMTPVEVKAPELSAFAGPTRENLGVAPENGQLGTGIFTITDPRRRERQVQQPVGA